MTNRVVQVYEIQTPEDARAVIALGVDHVGSVVTSADARHDPVLRKTVSVVRRLGAISSLIPLYIDPDAVFDTLDYYRPQIIHFCDHLVAPDGDAVEAARSLQAAVKRRFPDVRIMRSIPIAPHAGDNSEAIFRLATRLEPLSDYFLTDTLIEGPSEANTAEQPVSGFVGITGLTCDWSVAAQLVVRSRIPVILAGGISPENVAEGIQRVQPFGVDSCTCTNARDDSGQPIRFMKDLTRVQALVRQARLADEHIQAQQGDFGPAPQA